MFFVGLSYDYRLILLALAGAGLILKSALVWQLKAVLWVSLLIALWGSAAFGDSFLFIPPSVKPFLVYGFHLLGDLAVFLWVGILLYMSSLVAASKMGWFRKLLGLITRTKNVG
jgi:hypothetical protein